MIRRWIQMELVFIRHGEPDYEKDSLTETGFKEAALLADRVAGMEVKDFFVSFIASCLIFLMFHFVSSHIALMFFAICSLLSCVS